MTKACFVAQMSLLTRNFGTSEYTEERAALIWSICKDLNDKAFENIIKFFLETKSVRYPPVPSEFREAAYLQRKQANSIEPKKQLEHRPESPRPAKIDAMVNNFLVKLGSKKEQQ